MRRFALALVFALACAPVFAIGSGEELADPAAEARARTLFRELRCMVCQNQSIDDSDAPLAKDLRMLVRERVSAGDSEAEIKGFLVARYGDFVLLRPRMDGETLLLWTAPLIVLIGGAAAAILAYRRRSAAAQGSLSDEENRRLDAILDEEN